MGKADKKQQAKETSLMSVLSTLGFEPAKAYADSSSKIWYNSPFRGEGQASFIYFPKNNSWYDWGSGKGGDVIDFVMQFNDASFNEALDYLVTDTVRHSKYVPPTNIDKSKQGIGIVDVMEFQNERLIAYANMRGISTNILKAQCKEVHYCYYSWDHITHMAIGFENNKGGWELRNHKQKVCNSPKTYRMVRGSSDNNVCNVFEGFFDFLSYLQLNGFEKPDVDCFIMNSLVFAPFIVDETESYARVRLYLDNDHAADEKIKEYFVGSKYSDMRMGYERYSDYNDFCIDQVGM